MLQTGTTTTTIYPFKWYSIASSTGSGAKYATTTDYVFNGDTLLATVDQQMASGVATGTAKTSYIHPDHLGSTNVVTDASGTVVQTLDYYPYGATRISTNTGGADSARKYIGQLSDQSNLDYLQARYYDPTREQFLTQDPVFLGDPRAQNLADPQSLNSYSYAVSLAWRSDIENMLAYGWSDWPTHEAFGGCSWIKETFSKISLFEEHCLDPSLQSPLSENTDGTVVQTQPTKYNYTFKLQLFTKNTTQSPLEVVKGWYANLTLDEQKVCEIQDADEPVDHFSDGTVHWTENPHPSPHKTRYKIDIKPEISQKIMQTSEPADPKYDYMCGHLVGTTFAGHPPYFEFDDRSPNKYLLVGTYGQEGPLIDLNSIRF